MDRKILNIFAFVTISAAFSLVVACETKKTYSSNLTLTAARASAQFDGAPFNDPAKAKLFDGLPCEYPVTNPAAQDGKGSATFQLDKNGDEAVITFSVKYSGLSGKPVMSHIHLGQATGQLGPVVQTLCGPPPPDLSGPGGPLGHSGSADPNPACPTTNDGPIEGSFRVQGNAKLNLSAEQELAELQNAQLMVNIHTCLNQHGEISGQIFP